MAVTSAASSSQSIARSVWQQVQLRQAQQNADQARANAQALRAAADAAQRAADQEQDKARNLGVKADQATQEASQADRGLQALRSTGQAYSQLDSRLGKVVQAVSANRPQPTPVVNTQGQVTGKVVNTSA